MNAVRLRVLLLSIAVAGATGQPESSDPSVLNFTNSGAPSSVNISRNDVQRLLKCICRDKFANCRDTVTTSIDQSQDSTTDISTVETLPLCQIHLLELIKCTDSDLCIIQCDLQSSSKYNDSVIITLEDSQLTEVIFQYYTEESICKIDQTGRVSSTTLPTANDETTTNISSTQAPVNHTAYYQSDELSSSSISGIAVGVTLGAAVLVCIIVGYLVCRRRYQNVTKKIPNPPAKSYLSKEIAGKSIKRIEDGCEYGNIASVGAKEAGKNASVTDVHSNQDIIVYTNSPIVLDPTDNCDGLEYGDTTGVNSMHVERDYLNRASSATKNKYNILDKNSTYSNLPENYAALNPSFIDDVAECYEDISSQNASKYTVSTSPATNRTLPYKTTLDPNQILHSSISDFDAPSLSPDGASKTDSVYFELEKVTDVEEENEERENENDIYLNIS